MVNASSKELVLERKRTAITSLPVYKALVEEVDVITVQSRVRAGKTAQAHIPLIVVDGALWFAVKPISDALNIETKAWLGAIRDQQQERLLRFKVSLGKTKKVPNYNNLLYVRYKDVDYMLKHAPDQELKRMFSEFVNKVEPVRSKLEKKGKLSQDEPQTRSVGSRHSRNTLVKMAKEALEFELKSAENHKKANLKVVEKSEPTEQATEQPTEQPAEGGTASATVLENQAKIKELEDMVLELGEEFTALKKSIESYVNRDVGPAGTITLSLEQLKGLIRA